VFFLVHDGRRMWAWAVGLFPAGRRADVEAIGVRVWAALSAYVRGVAMVAVVDAVLIGLALLVIGVPLVVPLMVITFLGAFVPLVGALVAGAVAALVALVIEGVIAAVLVTVAIVVIQQLEGDLLYPLVVGRAIALHPVAILLALTAGTVVAGIIGALLAVPVAAAVWTAADHLRRDQVSPPPEYEPAP
jgi:predicted PurR-regulated permease PerM